MAIIKDVDSLYDFKVQLVNALPDLYVYVTKNKSESKNSDSIWFFSDTLVDKKVKFVNSLADVKIQYVNVKSRAGWRNKTHKLQNRIG